MREETDPNTKYANECQIHERQTIYRNKFKQQLAHKKDFLLNEISQSMSSSVPSYTFDQVYYFNQETTDKLEYEFELDQTFMNIDSDYKTIGLREIRVIPEPFVLNFMMFYYFRKEAAIPTKPAVMKSDGVTIDQAAVPGKDAVYAPLFHEVSIQVTSSNNFEEIIDTIIASFNQKTGSQYLKYEYNSKTHQLKIWTDKEDNNGTEFHQYKYKFRFINNTYKPEIYENIYHLFNIPKDNSNILPNTYVTELTFDNVWDRRTLYIHSSIAITTPYNYLGNDNEFYQTPSKLYKWTSKSKTCRVWTSFVGKTPVKLYHQPFLIQFQLSASCHR
jgi:hypothetical protein